MGLFEENGPFRMNRDGATLMENPHSWNKVTKKQKQKKKKTI